MKLAILPDTLAVCRLAPDSLIPDWASGDFISITRTRDELSIVCMQSNVPPSIQCERDWCAFQVKGQLDFSLTGILVSIATPLAQASIPIFAISTFDTDYVLVKAIDLSRAQEALTQAGYRIE